MLDPPIPERAFRRRLAALETRLSSLTFPPPLRRALSAALLALEDAEPGQVPALLSTLVAPAREAIGPDAAEAISQAARRARERRLER